MMTGERMNRGEGLSFYTCVFLVFATRPKEKSPSPRGGGDFLSGFLENLRFSFSFLN